MAAPSLRTIPLVTQLAKALDSLEANARFAGLPKGTVRGTIVDVNDPENRGRVRVIFDAMNPEDIPQIEGAGEFSVSRDGVGDLYSHWIDASPSFVGKQPEGLIGLRVNIVVSNGQYHYAILQDVLCDPQNLTDSAQARLSPPNNNSVARLAIYENNSLPPASADNHGLIVIENNGPMGGSWPCVCLLRGGQYIWVRLCDLAHGHAGGNDVTSQVDSMGNRPSPGQMSSSYDHVFVTSHQEMKKEGRTSYSTRPAGNPWGEECRWAPPPMSDIKPREFSDGSFFNQDTALEFARNSGFIDNIAGSFTTAYNPEILASIESVPGSKFALDAVEKGQKALKAFEALRKVVADPTSFVVDTAMSAVENYIPPATKAVISTLQNPQGAIKTVLSSLPKLPNPFS